jgi:TetR/AcrR family transcriptional regulator, mexJK operon transcriptional repressor
MMATEIDALGHRILDAALDAFVLDGFKGTTTDQIAAGAAASKQSIYRRFGDKEGLFAALVTDFLDRVRAQIVETDVSGCRTGEEAVRLLARQLADSILDRRVQRFRRLVIAEAARFPELGTAYYEGAFTVTLDALARVLDGLVARDLLRIDDTVRAANQLAGLTLWLPSNRIMMTGRLDAVAPDEIDAGVESGVSVFLAAYGVTGR